MEKLKRGNLRSDEIKKKNTKKKKMILYAGIMIACIIAAVVIISYINRAKVYNAFKAYQTNELSSLEGCKFLSYKNGILKMNRDGAETTSADGKKIWNVSYDMKEPIGDVSGSYAVIADMGGKTAYIIDGSGKANALNLIYPIVDVQVASQGVAAIVTNNGTNDWIYMFGMDSAEELAYVKSTTSSDGFPIDITLSADGRKLITSYVKAQADSYTSQVTFYNFGEVGKNATDNLVGSFTFEGEFVPRVEFITNDSAAVFKDDGICLYSFKEYPSESGKIDFTDKIQSIFYDNDYIGVVLEDSSGTKGSQVIAYNTQGKVIFDKTIDFTYTRVTASNDYIVFYDTLRSHVLNMKGKEIFQYSFETNVNHIFEGRNSKEFIAITDIGMTVYEMVETKEE